MSAAIGGRGKDTPSTPTGAVAADVSSVSTPGVPLPPNPPPTPQGGIPVPPPPPPALPGAAGGGSNLKRVNWEKIHGTEGTIWKEVWLQLYMCHDVFVSCVLFCVQLSGLEEALEYYDIEEKFARKKPKDGIFQTHLCIHLDLSLPPFLQQLPLRKSRRRHPY